jgi:DNA-binding PucR family transcriptional regulator
MEICFELTDDPAELRELLDLSSLSISAFIDDTVAAVSERMRAERDELTRGTHAERRAAVALLLEGAPIARARAEAQLGYRLAGPHTAAIVWSTAPAPTTDPTSTDPTSSDTTSSATTSSDTTSSDLEAAAEAVVRAAGAAHRLTIVASAAALWVWLPVGSTPHPADLAARLTGSPGVRVALGRPGTDVDGFRRSHLDAAAAQRMLTRLASPQQVARYEDVQLAALLTADPAQAEEFLADTLGGLLTADADTQRAVATYVAEQCSTTRTARRLYTHRNTVLRRLARADELLPRPLAENVVAVAAALEVLRWGRPSGRAPDVRQAP